MPILKIIWHACSSGHKASTIHILLLSWTLFKYRTVGICYWLEYEAHWPLGTWRPLMSHYTIRWDWREVDETVEISYCSIDGLYINRSIPDKTWYHPWVIVPVPGNSILPLTPENASRRIALDSRTTNTRWWELHKCERIPENRVTASKFTSSCGRGSRRKVSKHLCRASVEM